LDGCADNMQYKTKTEMVQSISEFQTFYDSCNENTFVSRETV